MEEAILVNKKQYDNFSEALKVASTKKKPCNISLPAAELQLEGDFPLCGLVQGCEGTNIYLTEAKDLHLVASNVKTSIENVNFLLSEATAVIHHVSGNVVEFTGCNFSKIDGESNLRILSKTKFIKCSFNDVQVSSFGEGDTKFEGCEFKASVETAEQTEPAVKSLHADVSFAECTFDGHKNSIVATPKAFEPIEVSVKNCNFTSNGGECHISLSPEKEEDISIVGKNAFNEDLKLNFSACSTMSIEDSEFKGGKVAIEGKAVVCSIRDTKLSLQTEKALTFDRSYAIINKIKVLNNSKTDVIGIEVTGTSSSIMKESLIMGTNTGIELSCDPNQPSKHVLENMTFIKNRTSLGIHHAQADIGGCVFVNSSEYSMRVEVREEDLKTLRINREPKLKFWYNSFVEKVPGSKLIDNEWVTNTYVKDPHPFVFQSAGEHLLYVPDLYERLVRGYVDLEFRRGKARMGDVGVKSVVLIKKLVKTLDEPILARILNNPRLGAFLVRKNINGVPIFPAETLFSSWLDLANLKVFADVFDALNELRGLNVITQDVYLIQVSEMRQLYLKLVINSRHSRVLEFLKTLSESKPLEALWFTSRLSDKRHYADIENGLAQFEENQLVKYKVLVHILELPENVPFEIDLDISWIKHFALQQLVEQCDFTDRALKEIPFPVKKYWIEALMQENNVKKISRLPPVTDTDPLVDIVQSCNLIVRGEVRLNNSVVRALIERQTLTISPAGQVPVFLRRLTEIHNNLAGSFKLYSLLNTHLPTRDLVGSNILWNFLIQQRKYYVESNTRPMFDDGSCSRCGRFYHGYNLMQAKYCEVDDHIFCRRCFKLEVESGHQKNFGVCPGRSCGVLLDNSDLALAEINEDYKEKALNYRLKEYKKSLRLWYPCVIESCKGGANRLDKRTFTCELCGMFGKVNKDGKVEVSLLRTKDVRAVWISCVLFRQAVIGSRHIEHYFPYGYAPRYLLTGRGEPNKNALGRLVTEMPYDVNGIGRIANPVTVGLMNYLMSTCPTTLRMLTNVPAIIPKMKTPQEEFYRYRYNNNRRNNNANPPPKQEFWLQVQSEQAKEIRFQKAKAKHGAYYAWHGSGVYNWHSIIRVGLKNMSNTKYMSAGAAYGAGIYHSPSFSTASGYSHGLNGGGMDASKQIFAIAVTECVNNKVKKSGNIYVAQEEDHVQIRFVYIVMYN